MDHPGAVMRAACLLCLACGACAEEIPAYGEAVIVVDADLPVPRAMSRLRVDLYDAKGRWFESRDVARPDPGEWPLSFSVYSEDPDRSKRVWVRLRAYPEGRVRDYLGERFVDWGGASPTPPHGDGEPRLVRDGIDRTPAGEPEPLVTVDRLLLLRLKPDVVAEVRVMLHAACAGTMAWLSPEGVPVAGVSASCVETEQERTLVATSPLAPRSAPAPASLEALARGCGGEAVEGRVCIPGGVDVLGSRELIFYPLHPAVPERIAVHAPFWIDRDEVTVARYRAALAAGFVPASPPVANDGPLGRDLVSTCTYSRRDLGRERYALTCIRWQTARDLCRFWGGELPTEAQWERMARLAGVRGPSHFPWGDEPPSCARAVYGRITLAGTPGACQALGPGPLPLDASAADLTPLGLIAVAGNSSEWVLDAFEPYDGACWAASSVTSPRCWREDAAERSIRGGSWAAPPTFLPAPQRFGLAATGETPFVGVRCVYPAEPAP
jgi:formylglycine-generating enzyme required for sulfatase activity